MKRLLETIQVTLETMGQMVRAGAQSVTSHWALAGFSLIAAFGLWMAIQDVENPQIEGTAPSSGVIPVRAVNVPDGYLVDSIPPVSVRVRARRALIDELLPSDFEAKVDVSGVDPNSDGAFRPVIVTSRRNGVSVVGQPEEVLVRLVPSVSREVQVSINRTSRLPSDYEEAEPPKIDPAFVTISGREELVSSVASVELDVPLSGVREQNYSYKGDLVARTQGGNPVEVQISQSEATAVFKIQQIFSTRTIAITPRITGTLPPGFRLGNITVEPLAVVVTGPMAVIDSLGPWLSTEPVDVTGARQAVTKTTQIERPENVSFGDRPNGSVVVRVEILPAECGGPNSQCEAVTWVVAPRFTDVPAGLAPEPRAYSVEVRVTGSLAQLRALKDGDIRADVSLADGQAGAAGYAVRITGPEGLRFEADPITVTLVSVGAVP